MERCQCLPRSVRGRKGILSLAVILLVFLVFSLKDRPAGYDNYLSGMSEIDSWRSNPDVRRGLSEFWIDLAHDLSISRPTGQLPRHTPPTEALKALAKGANVYSIDMTPDEIESMKTAHRTFLERTSSLSLTDLYIPASKGIVTTAGGKYIPVFLVSLRLLRRTGSTLPVEVFLAHDGEYDESLCKEVLPSLNARCRVLTHILGADDGVKIESYQFKIFAILFSSFEDVLFLDADNLALTDPRTILDSHPFTSYGLVLWPDFWPSTVSSIFYEIQGRSQPQLRASQTTETGQILISKRKHLSTLILATYYNYYGPNRYYSLLSQGAPGEGDKETFSTAAEFHSQPYYQVPHKVSALGHFDSKNNFHGTAMLQFDPRFDSSETDPQPAFIHA